MKLKDNKEYELMTKMLKKISRIENIKIYTNFKMKLYKQLLKIEIHNEGDFGATPTMERIEKGVYEIRNTLGLRLGDGWYIESPNDRNGNKYFNIEWEQNIEPQSTKGVVDEYRNGVVLTIKTYKRVWNKDTGIFENGDAIDINDLQDRYVSLRFNEIKVEQEVTNG